MAHQDFYSILGVPRTASHDEIRKAYKKIARENHPDAKPNDTAASERFKQATEAYEVLGDEDKRKQYDQFGEAYKHLGKGGAGGPRRGPVDIDLGDLFGGGAGGQVDLGDLFGGMFGGGGGRRRGQPRPSRGQDLQTAIEIPFQMAAEGGGYDVTVQRGSQSDRLTVKVPPGVRDGATIRLAGQGEPGRHNGASGDLLITVHVAAHPYFRRDGNDVVLELPISVSEALLGARIDVPTLVDGEVTLTVPAGTSSGTRLRLRGKGFPDSKTRNRGDQFVAVKIVVPKELDARARTLVEELAEAAPLSPRLGLW